jgi:hypothetical protein
MKKELVDVEEFSASILAGLKETPKLIKLPAKRDCFTGKIHESAILLYGDSHCGQVNKFLNAETNQMETTYDTDIMIKEYDRLLDSMFGINQLLSASYTLDKLYIFGLGDYLENDVIFSGQRFFIDKGIGNQLLTQVKVFTNFLIECSKMFSEIEFICISGNHGRFQSEKESAPISNNFDYLFGKMIEARFEGNERIKVIVPESWWYIKEIYGWKYFLHHGDIIYSWMGIPFYGLKKQGTQRRVEMPFDIECIGHFHQRMELPVGRNSITLVNGAWIDKSEYGWRKFGNLSRPEQVYFGVNPKRARTWNFNLDLLHSKSEWKEVSVEKKQSTSHHPIKPRGKRPRRKHIKGKAKKS